LGTITHVIKCTPDRKFKEAVDALYEHQENTTLLFYDSTNGWIKTSSQNIPPEFTEIFVYCKDGKFYRGELSPNDYGEMVLNANYADDQASFCIDISDIDYWMFIPELPEPTD